MSEGEEEYVVETIQRAKVELDKRGRKTWKYYVKWKGYGQEENSWEPIQSFVGSEHFVETFWQRTRCNRDHTQLKHFEEDEEILPVGPPGKVKGKKKSEPIARKEESHSSPRRAAKRKEVDSEGEVKSIIGEDMEETVSRQSPRKRPASAIEQVEEAPSAKRRRGRAPAKEQSDTEKIHETVSAVRSSSRRGSTSRARPTAKKPATSTSTSRATGPPASPTKASTGVRGNPRNHRKKEVAEPPSEVIEIDSSDDEPVAPPADEPERPQIRKPTSAVYVTVPPSPSKVNVATKKMAAHHVRAANPLVKQVDDTVAAEGGSSLPVKSKLAHKFMSAADKNAGPSTPRTNGAQSSSVARPKISGTRAGPGRSSRGVVTGSTSLLTAVKGGGLQTIRKPVATPKAKLVVPVEDPDAMAVDEAPEDPLLAPLSTEDLDHLARLTQAPVIPVDDLPDYEEISDRDAEGESDHDFAGQAELTGLSPKTQRQTLAVATDETKVTPKVANYDEETANAAATSPTVSVKEPDAPSAPKQPVINPPDTAIGNSDLSKTSSFAAWKATTIFDNISPSSFRRSADPPATSSEPSQSIFSIPVSPSVRISVVLKDVQTPINSARKRLDEIATQGQTGAPGKFYKGQTALDMLKALGRGGSCARAVLESGADDTQQRNFDRFQSSLKDGSLFVVMIGPTFLAFCSSENNDIAAMLGASPNLTGLGDNVLVSEVVIADDAAYLDAILNAEDVRW